MRRGSIGVSQFFRKEGGKVGYIYDSIMLDKERGWTKFKVAKGKREKIQQYFVEKRARVDKS